MGEKRDKEIKPVQLAFFMFTMTPFCFCDVIKRRCLMLSNNALAILNYVIALNMTWLVLMWMININVSVRTVVVIKEMDDLKI